MGKKANSNAQTSTSAPTDSSAKAAEVWGGAVVDDKFFQTFVPPQFQQLPRTADSINQLLTAGGYSGDRIRELQADTQNGATTLNRVLSDPNFQASVAKRLNLQPAGSQVSGGGSTPSTPGAASKPASAAPAAGPQSGQSGAAAAAKEPKKPAPFPKPRSPAPQTEGVKSFMGISGAATKIGGQRGGPLKRVEEKIMPDGSRVTITEFYEPGPGNTLSKVGSEVADAAGNVVASEGVTDTTAPKQDAQPKQQSRKTWAEWSDPENRPTMGERFTANREAATKRGVAPNLANDAGIALGTWLQHMGSEATAMASRNLPGIAVVAPPLAYGAYRLMNSGSSAPPAQPPQVDPGNYNDLFGIPGRAAPPPQPAPQGGNPAGTPPANNTTLMQLQRLMQSREMA